MNKVQGKTHGVCTLLRKRVPTGFLPTRARRDLPRTRSRSNARPVANRFPFDVPTFKGQGIDIDNSSVNIPSISAPKRASREIIDKLSATVSTMFENGRVQDKKKAGESQMHVMIHDGIVEM